MDRTQKMSIPRPGIRKSAKARVTTGDEGARVQLGYRPLYRQVKELLMQRLSDGTWSPGQLLPSEPEIAAGLGVSPGTVRKALDELSAESLVIRRQGRGTFVARHDEERILFQFFRLIPDSGERRFPEGHTISVAVAKAAADVAARLGIAPRAPVISIERVRLLDGRPCIHERIVLPRSLFPGIERHKDLPNNLYAHYSAQYGVTIARGTERLKAVAADVRQAQLLGVRTGQPMLQVERVAFGVDGTPAEWRVSVCHTDQAHYLSELK
jgi:GntR family transcriptional regulator